MGWGGGAVVELLEEPADGGAFAGLGADEMGEAIADDDAKSEVADGLLDGLMGAIARGDEGFAEVPGLGLLGGVGGRGR